MLLNGFSITDIFATDTKIPLSNCNSHYLSPVSYALQKQYEDLLKWLAAKGWLRFLSNIVGISSIDLNDATILANSLDNISRIVDIPGFDDFGGNKLVEPGNPSLSLLYHMLASPRVKDSAIVAYPSYQELDVLENYIFALKPIDKYLDGVNKCNLH